MGEKETVHPQKHLQLIDIASLFALRTQDSKERCTSTRISFHLVLGGGDLEEKSVLFELLQGCLLYRRESLS